MSRYVPSVANPPLGKLYYDQHDVGALKCLVAIRMTKRRVDVEVVRKAKKGGGGGKTTLFTAAGGNVQLRDPFSIAWFLANYDYRSFDKGLPDRYGAQIVQWNSFSDSELRPHISGLLHHRSGSGSGGNSSKADEMRKRCLATSLEALNSALKDKTFLVGEKFTLADVCVASDLVPVLDPGWALHFDNAMIKGALKRHHVYLFDWYSAVSSRSIFKQALSEVRWPPKPSPPQPQAAVSAAAHGDAGGEQPHQQAKKAGGPRRWKRKKESPLSAKDLPQESANAAGKPGVPLKVLCLHGYRQNAEIFRQKIGSFRKLFGGCVDFTFVTAPHRALPVSPEDINQNQCGWWLSGNCSDDASREKVLDASLELVKKTFESQGPFDGILGFSQGAAFATLICLMAQRQPDLFPPSLKFNFVMLFATYVSDSACSKELNWYDSSAPDFKPISIPSLHVMGSGDEVISCAKSEQVLGLFADPTVVRHDGGHFVPSSKSLKLVYCDFLKKASEASPAGGKDENQNPSDSKSVAGGEIPSAVEPALSAFAQAAAV